MYCCNGICSRFKVNRFNSTTLEDAGLVHCNICNVNMIKVNRCPCCHVLTRKRARYGKKKKKEENTVD